MVKKRTIRQKLRDKAAKAPQEVQPVDSGVSGHDEAAKLPVGRSTRRKLTKKLQFLSKIREAQEAALSAKKVIGKKSKRRKAALSGLALQDWSSLNDALPELKEKPGKTKKVLSHKDRQNLVVKETQLLQAVLGNASFQADPYAAVLGYVKSAVEMPVDREVKTALTKNKKKNRKNKPDSMACG